MKNIKIVITLFFTFLKLCFKYPSTLKENFGDVKLMYYLQTDPEMIEITEKLNNG